MLTLIVMAYRLQILPRQSAAGVLHMHTNGTVGEREGLTPCHITTHRNWPSCIIDRRHLHPCPAVPTADEGHGG